MRRYRLIISKVVYPLVSFICIISGLKFYQSIDQEIRWLLGKKEGLLHDFYFMWLLIVTILFVLFFLFLILSAFLFLKQPRMKQYDKALITVLKFEEQGGDVIEIKGKELRDELSYKLSAKRVYCPTCHKPTDGVIGTKLTCRNCGKTFIVS